MKINSLIIIKKILTKYMKTNSEIIAINQTRMQDLTTLINELKGDREIGN